MRKSQCCYMYGSIDEKKNIGIWVCVFHRVSNCTALYIHTAACVCATVHGGARTRIYSLAGAWPRALTLTAQALSPPIIYPCNGAALPPHHQATVRPPPHRRRARRRAEGCDISSSEGRTSPDFERRSMPEGHLICFQGHLGPAYGPNGTPG